MYFSEINATFTGNGCRDAGNIYKFIGKYYVMRLSH